MSINTEREDRAIESIMRVYFKADKEKWTKERWDNFWKKVYAHEDKISTHARQMKKGLGQSAGSSLT